MSHRRHARPKARFWAETAAEAAGAMALVVILGVIAVLVLSR